MFGMKQITYRVKPWRRLVGVFSGIVIEKRDLMKDFSYFIIGVCEITLEDTKQEKETLEQLLERIIMDVINKDIEDCYQSNKRNIDRKELEKLVKQALVGINKKLKEL